MRVPPQYNSYVRRHGHRPGQRRRRRRLLTAGLGFAGGVGATLAARRFALPYVNRHVEKYLSKRFVAGLKGGGPQVDKALEQYLGDRTVAGVKGNFKGVLKRLRVGYKIARKNAKRWQ